MISTDADILAAVRAQFHTDPPKRLGIAVSGGGDSIALMHILSRCFEPGAVELFAATVDHGLRSEAAQEAEMVARQAAGLGIRHTTLKWDGWDKTGNLQDQARRARYQLLADWAKSNEITILALGHTADDQAETVLMRLARSSGVTGLAAMPVRRTMLGITIFRPMLGLTRVELRSYLHAHDMQWVEDPSNVDLRFERIKMRRALEVLEPLGLSARALVDVARNMSQAREALDWYSFLAARDCVTVNGGDVVLDLQKFRTLPDEIARRLLVRVIIWISGADYAPRRASLIEMLNSIRLGKPATLGGCRVLRQGSHTWICREFNAVRRTRCSSSEIWDGRWQLSNATDQAAYSLRALGRRGLMHCPDWRATGRPHAALLASPAVWQGDDLVAAPLAGLANGWHVELVGGSEELFASLLSH